MPTVTWNPLVQQVAEADTLYMFDADAEKLLTPGAGGLIMANAQGGDVPWTGTSLVRDVVGKFLRGIHCYVRGNGFLWMPIEGLLGASEFTIEFFVKGDVSWANAFGANLFSVTMGPDEQMTLDIHQNVMVLRLSHQQAAAAVAAVLVYTPGTAIPAGQWVNCAITFSGTTLKLYIDGVNVGTTSASPPANWSCTSATSGLTLLGFNGAGADGWSLSDLRISRKARVPGVPIAVDGLNTLTVTPATATGATVNQDLLGGLLTLNGTSTEVMATAPTQALTGIRSGKYLSTAPIKAGAPDGTHPTAGISGQWSYDWRVADRTFAYHTRLGMKTIGDLGSTPQIIGGDQAPYSGGQLTNDVNGPSSRSDWANYSGKPPSNNTQWGQMVRDLVHHTLNELGHDVRYWGVWNEPDTFGTGHWEGTEGQLHAVFAATVAAAKQVDPTLKIGGLEISDWNESWVKNLIQYCAQNSVRLDYVSWHPYTGYVGELQRAKSQVALWAAQYSLGYVPEIAVSEWCWQIYNTHGLGVLPWRNYEYHRNDWAAAFDAAFLLEMQRLGVLYGIYTSPVAMDGSFGSAPDGQISGFDSSGLMSNTAPWSGLNVFRQWSLLKPTVVSSSYVGQPGVFTQASKDGSGLVTIMVSHLRYRKDLTPNLTIQLPGGYSGAPVTHYIVDGTHSNLMDAGAGHEDLETIASSAIDGSNSLTVALPPRSSHVFVIGTPSADTTPPQTTITVAPPNGTATSVSFSFTSNEAGSTFETRMDGGSWVTSVSPKTYSGLSVGSHTFDVRAIDPATNVDPSPAAYTWQVTATGGGSGGGPPVTAGLVADFNPALIAGTDGTAVEAADQSGLAHHAVQATGTKRPLLKTNIINGLPVLRFDGVDDFLQTASFTLPQPAHVFIVAKYDSARVANDTLFDGQAPDSRMRVWRSATGLTMYAQSGTIDLTVTDLQTTFHAYGFLYDDAGAGSHARKDGGTAVTGSVGTAVPSGITLGALASGGEPGPVDIARVLIYNVALSSTDRVAIESFLNNTYFGAAPGDTTPPVTTITSSPANSTSPSATFVFSANEPSTFETNLDGAAWVASSSPKSYSGLSVGQHTFQVRATDIAANLETTPKSHSWTISAPPPTTSVTAEELWLTDPRIGWIPNSNAMQGAKYQAALDLGLSALDSRGTLRLNPGYGWCDVELSYGRSGKILHIVGSGASEDGSSGSAIYWTELGAGKFPLQTVETNANYPIEWRDFTMLGPNTRNGYGEDQSDMWGPKVYGRSLLERVNVIYFRTGIIAKADHHKFFSCRFAGNSYGMYFGINDGQGGGDFTIVDVDASGCRKASIGIGTTHALGGFTFIQGHYGFSPAAIHRFEEGLGLQRRIPFLEHGDFINTPFEACGPQGVIWDEPGDGWISIVKFSSTGEAGEPNFAWPGKPAARGLWDLGGIDDVTIGGDFAPWHSPAVGIDKPLIYCNQAIYTLTAERPNYIMQRVHEGAGHTLLEAPTIEDVVIGRPGSRAGGVTATVIKSDGALARYDAVELIDTGSGLRARKARNTNPYVGQVVAPTVDGAAAYIATHGANSTYIQGRVTTAVRAGESLVVDPAVPGNLKRGGSAFGAGTVAVAVAAISAGAVGPVKITSSQVS